MTLRPLRLCVEFFINMIPKRSKYAIKALTALAKVYRDKQHLSIATIAEKENIPTEISGSNLAATAQRRHGEQQNGGKRWLSFGETSLMKLC